MSGQQLVTSSFKSAQRSASLRIAIFPESEAHCSRLKDLLMLSRRQTIIGDHNKEAEQSKQSSSSPYEVSSVRNSSMDI